MFSTTLLLSIGKMLSISALKDLFVEVSTAQSRMTVVLIESRQSLVHLQLTVAVCCCWWHQMPGAGTKNKFSSWIKCTQIEIKFQWNSVITNSMGLNLIVITGVCYNRVQLYNNYLCATLYLIDILVTIISRVPDGYQVTQFLIC